MSSNKKVEPRAMNDAAVIKAVLPRHTVKHLAALLAVPLGTAHEWVHRHFSPNRRREVAAALLIELERQERHLIVVRRHLEIMAGGYEEVAGAVDGNPAVQIGKQADKTIGKVRESR